MAFTQRRKMLLPHSNARRENTWSFQDLERSSSRSISERGDGTYISPYLLDENDDPQQVSTQDRCLSTNLNRLSIEPGHSSSRTLKRSYGESDSDSDSYDTTPPSSKKRTTEHLLVRETYARPLPTGNKSNVIHDASHTPSEPFSRILDRDYVNQSSNGNRPRLPMSQLHLQSPSQSSPGSRTPSLVLSSQDTHSPSRAPYNREQRNIPTQAVRGERSPTDRSETIDLRDSDSDDNSTDDDVEIVNVVEVRKRLQASSRANRVPRILCHENYEVTGAIRYCGIRIRSGICVEFEDGTFIRIHKVFRDLSSRSRNGHTIKNDYILVGQMYVRTEVFGPDMPRQRVGTEWSTGKRSKEVDTRLPQAYRGRQIVNEVVQKIRVAEDEHPDNFGLWRRPIRDVIEERKLRFTNQAESDMNCTTLAETQSKDEIGTIKRSGVLTCRWIDTVWYDAQGKWKEQSITRPTIEEVDEHWFTSPDNLQKLWRGHTALLTDSTPIKFGDGFCGAGGMSTGAQQAGLAVDFSFDLDPKKISTHRQNFPRCKSFVRDVADIIEMTAGKKRKLHVLHLSPPCQPFSSANTIPNQMKNERNQTPLLACGDVIKAVRPRIVTIEETQGIVQRHHIWFYALINQFTELGFSLRWTNIKCSEFGVPQLRRRFIIIAAAPGEVLPTFPRPTYNVGEATIKTVLDTVQRFHQRQPLTHHEKLQLARPRPRYDPACLAKTITCGGGENYHPSGKRLFTPRELACLQTFPERYKFGTKEDGSPLGITEARLQVGNAVPPNVAKAVLTEVRKSLQSSDRARALRRDALAESSTKVTPKSRESVKAVVILDE